MTKKTENTDNKPADVTPQPASAAPSKKKNLSLDVSDVSEALERKISP